MVKYDKYLWVKSIKSEAYFHKDKKALVWLIHGIDNDNHDDLVYEEVDGFLLVMTMLKVSNRTVLLNRSSR